MKTNPNGINVWCGMSAQGIIGPYFIENNIGQGTTLNARKYLGILKNFLVPELKKKKTTNFWFQQDGASSHTTIDAMEFLKRTFGENIISLHAKVEVAT